MPLKVVADHQKYVATEGVAMLGKSPHCPVWPLRRMLLRGVWRLMAVDGGWDAIHGNGLGPYQLLNGGVIPRWGTGRRQAGTALPG